MHENGIRPALCFWEGAYMKKHRLAALCALAFLLAALIFAQALLVPKYQRGVVEGSMIAEYYRDEAPHDVLMVGDCELYENISTVELFREHGISSYIRGSAQQLTWHSYYLLEDALRTETPKVVVFNVLALKYNAPQSEAYNRMSIDGMRWNMSKVRAIFASKTEDERFIEYLFPLLRYHARWSELTAQDTDYLFRRDKVTHNGYYMRADTKPQAAFPPPMPLADYTLGENAMGYLQKMADLCKEKGIELLLIKAPTEYPHWYEQWDAQVADFAEENGLLYINCVPLQAEIGLDMQEDTYDAGLHLNLQGAEKFARWLGEILVENYDLPDRREDPEVSALWQEKCDFYDDMLAQQLAELSEHGELVSFGANAIE